MNPQQLAEDEDIADIDERARYLVAKHVPDQIRQEVRNVGVILLTKENNFSKFIAQTGRFKINLNAAPKFVTEPYLYRQWFDYWNHLLNDLDILQDLAGRGVNWQNPEDLESALLEGNKPSWYLQSGGVIWDPVEEGQEEALVERLFNQLVSEEGEPIQTAPE